MGSSPGFVSNRCDQFALFRLAFALAAAVTALTAPHRLTRWLILQKARHYPLRGFDCLSAHSFRVYFTPLTGVLFNFPSRYLFSIGHAVYLALEGGPPIFPPG